MMTSDSTSFPARRAAAARNRDKILAAAMAAFTDPVAEISMAEIARRAGVGMATLYRNFPGRRELLEALYANEVDALCEAAARAGEARAPGAALLTWLHQVFAFIPSKGLIVSELLAHTGSAAVPGGNRARALAAGRPLLRAAQDAHEVRDDLTLEQIFDMIVAIAKIQGEPGYLEPMLQTMLDGLRPPGDDHATGPTRP